MTPFTPKKCRRLRRCSLLAIASVLLATPVAADNPYWDEFGDQAVKIQQMSGGSRQTLEFVDFEDGKLIASLDGGVGEISLPVSESMIQSLRLEVEGLQRANDMIDQGNFEGAIRLLRPQVYPLIKFSGLPESFTQLHIPVRTLVSALISNRNFEEARDILSRIDLGTSSLDYSELSIRLMNALLNDEAFEAAASIIRRLPVEGQYAENIRPILNAADTLRSAERYEVLIPIYREIESVVSPSVRDNIRMWLAYSLVLADRLDEAAPLIESLEEPNPDERLFSLYKLLEGSGAHRRENYGRALDLLTRGFVRAQTSYVWVPEMLYLIGDCYQRAEDPNAARNVWSEIVALYPDSSWAVRAEASLAELPPVQPQDSES